MWLETKDGRKLATFGKVNYETRRAFEQIENKFDNMKVFLHPYGENDQIICILRVTDVLKSSNGDPKVGPKVECMCEHCT